ncbi:hypothetical protein ACLB2K_055222 [Fragaria x ananassa]
MVWCLYGCAFDLNSHFDGVGFVVGDEYDQFICGHRKAMSFDPVFSPAHIEALVGKVACRLVLEQGFGPARFETDSLVLVQAIHSIHDYAVLLRVVYEDVLHLFSQLPGCTFTHLYRDGNHAAYSLARWTLKCRPYNIFFASTPFLKDVITIDCN